MDSSDPHGSTSSNVEKEKKFTTMVQSKRASFFATYQKQSYSLPDSIMYYITKNPTSAEVYRKMIETCKDFFVKNPFLVISVLTYEVRYKWRVDGHPIDLDKLTSKIWITSKFRVQPNDSINNKAVNQRVASSLKSKLYRCDAKRLTLYDQSISFADLSLLISTAESIHFNNVVVKENNESIVGVEKILEIAVKAKKIVFRKPPILSVTSKTMNKLVKIPNFAKLDNFSLDQIPEAFDLEAFYAYMKKNQRTYFIFDFENSISDAYKKRLEEIVDEIFATEVLDYEPPYIRFLGLSPEKQMKLMLICC